MKKIAIIGGGISGLSAAYTLEKARLAGSPLEYRLFEASPRLGGVLLTEHIEGCVVEAGPDSFLSEKSWAIDFCREIGLGDQLITSNDAERKTYIYVKGHLVPMPDGLMFMVPTKILPIARSPLFSWSTKLRMAREWFTPTPPAQNSKPVGGPKDESVADFITRHYGHEMVDRLADPLLSGVYGGSASQLSVHSVLPRFVEMETKFGSLGKGMLAARKKIAGHLRASGFYLSARRNAADGRRRRRKNPDHLPYAQTPALIPLITRAANGHISIGGQSERFDAVILAVPAHAAACSCKPFPPSWQRNSAKSPTVHP